MISNPTAIPPYTLTVRAAARHIGLSKSTIYRLLAQHPISTIKVGRSTLVVMASLYAFLAACPPAKLQSGPVLPAR